LLSRLLVALGLAAALVAAIALAFLRTDFVGNNLCAYAVATIEEATRAQVKVARCSVDPAGGQLTIEDLQVRDPSGRIELTVTRLFVQVVVRPLLQRVRLERLEVDHPNLRLSLAQEPEGPLAPRTRQCLPDFLDRFELGRVEIRKARVLVEGEDGLRVDLPHARASIHGSGDALRVFIATRDGGISLPAWRSAGLRSTRIKAHVDLRGAGEVALDGADLVGTDASVFLRGKLHDLCHPHLEMSGSARTGDLAALAAHLLPGALSGVSGSAEVDASVVVNKASFRARGKVRGRALALEGIKPGDVEARFDATPERLKLAGIKIAMGPRGEVAGTAEIGIGDPRLPLAADLTVADMELAELLEKLGLSRSHVVLRSSGRVQAKGTLAPLSLSGDLALDLADFAVLDRRFEERARADRLLEFGRGHLAAAFDADSAQIAVRAAELAVGGSRLRFSGPFYTDVKRGLDLHVTADGFALEEFRGHVGSLSWRGRTTLDAHVTGEYGQNTIESRAEVKDLHLQELALGDVAAQVTFHKMFLALEGIEARKGRSVYSGTVKLDFDDDRVPVEAHLALRDAYLHDMVSLAQGLVPSLSAIERPEDFDGLLHGTLDVSGPVAGPDGTARLEFGEVALWREEFDGGHALIRLHGEEPRLQIEELLLQRGDAAVSAAGRIGPAWQLELDAHTSDFTLGDLDQTDVEWRGPLQITSRLRGSLEHPLLDTKILFTDGFAGKAPLGSGSIGIAIDGTALRFHGTVGTQSFEGRGKLDGDFAYSTTIALRFPDLSGYFDTFLPEAEIAGGSAAADVTLQGSLLRPLESEAAVSLTALKLVRGDIEFENDGPAQLSFGPRGIEVQRLAFRAPYTNALLSGVVGKQKLDLRVEANIDGRMLQGLTPDIEHASGQYLLHATLRGTPAVPEVLGNLRVDAAEVRLHGLPLSFREMNGSISFSQDALVIDEMSGKVNNGDAKVSGGIEMKSLSPRRVDLAVHMSDVAARLQESVSATLDGDLTLYGPPREPTLGGSLAISRMVYTENFDLERGLLDFNRRPPAPRVLAKSPIEVHFDLGVHLGRGVRIENNVARADLTGDLLVTGTTRRVGLLGSLNTVHGTAQFRGNEFQIEQGVLSFTDHQDIRPSFDFQASSQVKEYKVRLHAFGTPAEPHVTLVSDPVLAEADLGFLLTFGFVSQNLQQSSFSAAESGLALGVEALSRVTGFSEEVRRFIPKNAILKDPNIDFTSDFSVATSRLEPMARFRSRFVTDRLDLRVLQGLSTRRYRGVVAYQLTDQLSAQLQLDNEHQDVGTDFGADLRLHWEGGE
jgi:translocation and assembly module TamB